MDRQKWTELYVPKQGGYGSALVQKDHSLSAHRRQGSMPVTTPGCRCGAHPCSHLDHFILSSVGRHLPTLPPPHHLHDPDTDTGTSRIYSVDGEAMAVQQGEPWAHTAVGLEGPRSAGTKGGWRPCEPAAPAPSPGKGHLAVFLHDVVVIVLGQRSHQPKVSNLDQISGGQ